MNNDTPLKRCSKCKEELPATPEYFYRNSRKKSGLQCQCKHCKSEGNNYDESQIPPGQMRRCSKCKKEFPATDEYFHRSNGCKYGLTPACKPCRLKLNRQWHTDNKEQSKQNWQRWSAANKEHLERRDKEHYEKNKDHLRKLARERQKRNPERYLENNRRRRALRIEAGGTHTNEDIKLIYKWQCGRCWWCQINVGEKYHIDHRFPLIRGGSDGPRNIVISCPKCNMSKGSKMPWEWIGRLL